MEGTPVTDAVPDHERHVTYNTTVLIIRYYHAMPFPLLTIFNQHSEHRVKRHLFYPR